LPFCFLLFLTRLKPRGFRETFSLVKLHLESNRISDASADALNSALINLSGLTLLDLRNNSIGDGGASALGRGIKHVDVITQLFTGLRPVVFIPSCHFFFAADVAPPLQW
jgi:hypothetical protein